MTIPEGEKEVAEVKTFGGSQIFEWPITIVGKEVTLKWDFMKLGQYNALRRMYYNNGVEYTWDPEETGGGTYSVIIKKCTGEYFKNLLNDSIYRKDVVVVMSIRSKVLTATTTTTTTTHTTTSTTSTTTTAAATTTSTTTTT